MPLFIFFFSFLCALHSFIKTAFVFVLFLCRFYCGYAFTTKINRLLVNVNICFIQTEVKRDNKNGLLVKKELKFSSSILKHIQFYFTEYSDTSTESTYIYEIDTVAFIYWSYRTICDMCGYIYVVFS